MTELTELFELTLKGREHSMQNSIKYGEFEQTGHANPVIPPMTQWEGAIDELEIVLDGEPRTWAYLVYCFTTTSEEYAAYEDHLFIYLNLRNLLTFMQTEGFLTISSSETRN